MEADAVLFVLVVEQGKLSFCFLVSYLVSKISGVCLSVSANALVYVHLFCLFVLILYPQSTVLVILERIPVFLGFTFTKQRIKRPVGPTGVYLLDFFCSGNQLSLLLSPYPCFISLLYLDLYVLGDDASIS